MAPPADGMGKVGVAAAGVALSAVLLGGCAPLQIGVTDDSFAIDGQVFKTRAELADAIRASGAAECRVTPGAATHYKQVETAVLATRDAGCRSGIIGNIEQ